MNNIPHGKLCAAAKCHDSIQHMTTITMATQSSVTHIIQPLITRCSNRVFTASGLVRGLLIFDTHRIDIPQPIAIKLVTDDYIHDPYPCAKFGAYPSMEACWQIDEI